jgi:hypothetical protein
MLHLLVIKSVTVEIGEGGTRWKYHEEKGERTLFLIKSCFTVWGAT